MESNITEPTSKIEIKVNSPEIKFKKLAENTKGVLSLVEDPNVRETIPYFISYPEKNNQNIETVRVYRGINNILSTEATQLPSILRSATIIDQELIDLSFELGNNPSEENFNKIVQKNNQLGNENSNQNISDAKEFIADTMVEYNSDNYQDVFKAMHRWKNTASPFVSASSEISKSLSYAMLNAPGMIIIADIPKSLINTDFSDNRDKEIAVNGPIRQEYIQSILLINGRHSIEDKPFVESVKKLID
jgi:hypothetical protein